MFQSCCLTVCYIKKKEKKKEKEKKTEKEKKEKNTIVEKLL